MSLHPLCSTLSSPFLLTFSFANVILLPHFEELGATVELFPNDPRFWVQAMKSATDTTMNL